MTTPAGRLVRNVVLVVSAGALCLLLGLRLERWAGRPLGGLPDLLAIAGVGLLAGVAWYLVIGVLRALWDCRAELLDAWRGWRRNRRFRRRLRRGFWSLLNGAWRR